MEHEDQKMFFAGMALMGLAARGEAPSTAGQQAWQYAEFMMNFKPEQKEQA